MDINLVVRPASEGNLTADEALDSIPLTAMVRPLYLHTKVPSVSTGDKFAVKAEFTDGTNTLLTVIGTEIDAAGHSVMEIFCDHPDLAELDVTNDVTLDSTAAGSFGAVVQWISNSRVS